MISFLLTLNLLVNPPVYPVSQPPSHVVTTHAEDSFKIGKFLENNFVILGAALGFVLRLQHQIDQLTKVIEDKSEDIKKDNQNKIDLLAKDVQAIQTKLSDLSAQVDKTAGIAKEDVKRVERKLQKHEERLNKFVEFINADRITNSKPIFTFKDYTDED